MQRIDHSLPWSHLGTQRQLSVFRFGSGSRKVYIQASLHADELPGMRTAWELKKRLSELEAQGQLKGVIELVPVANPIGLDQHLQSSHLGRFESGSGKNFNRAFVELSGPVGDLIGDRLGSDAAANVALIRQTMGEVLDGLPAPTSQLQALQRLLLRHACDADITLDLHCDFEAAIHLYALPQHWPQWQSLAARLKAGVALLCEDSGGSSFDESCSTPWLRLARDFPRAAIPAANLATTLELGSMGDTRVEQAQANCEAILGFLAEQGFIDGHWPATPDACCEGMPFEGTQYLFAPHHGVVSFLREAGEWVERGDAIFEVVDPLNDIVTVVRAATSGVLFALDRSRYTEPGIWQAKVAGREPIRSGKLTND
ncbi:succinylglutamate desuccinylase/aspartoacylase family protein [Pseudomonas chlororaphis]|uniref:succinylglutamate desuccinylase/aspartoacylase family protein n=1 Tax=Pseudomonas chlororaphis TaxID=587753 RepID=UPI000F572E04|nr:succinylglutamate desuccinylase/aspartoacylase family protein [Pseudomonas chlororaphis]AZD54029.1 Succinylglutamate desuccinylase/aspartoacylase [Pseudomonas chlororaphis subsp. aurantiaca]AZD78763.1 Succinylglutamate desuccinylase/aspartoacylase [Pseudomonas chlororaphis subsp. aurantiaca]QQX61009.1 succinylglutamate desuccinylase/aspartoacylase family protein [Pseudomonas chlororaphis subsp. aurantiaca]